MNTRTQMKKKYWALRGKLLQIEWEHQIEGRPKTAEWEDLKDELCELWSALQKPHPYRPGTMGRAAGGLAH